MSSKAASKNIARVPRTTAVAVQNLRWTPSSSWSRSWSAAVLQSTQPLREKSAGFSDWLAEPDRHDENGPVPGPANTRVDMRSKTETALHRQGRHVAWGMLLEAAAEVSCVVTWEPRDDFAETKHAASL